jgi:hypothetical protein
MMARRMYQTENEIFLFIAPLLLQEDEAFDQRTAKT